MFASEHVRQTKLGHVGHSSTPIMGERGQERAGAERIETAGPVVANDEVRILFLSDIVGEGRLPGRH